MVVNAAHGKPVLFATLAGAALALAGGACAQSTTAQALSAYAPHYGAPSAGGSTWDAQGTVDQTNALTAVGDEPSSLPAPAADGPVDSLSGASASWTSSPAGDGAPLAVVGGDGSQKQSHDQTNNVSANSGLNGGVSDAH